MQVVFIIIFFNKAAYSIELCLIASLLESGGSVSCIAVDHQSGHVAVADDRNQVLVYMP